MGEGTAPATFAGLLADNAARRGGRPAIREKTRGIWRTLTWSDFAEEATALALALAARGVGTGTKVAFLSENRPRLYVAMAATHLLGAVAVPLFPAARRDELAPLIERAGVTHALAEDQEQVDKLLDIMATSPTLRSIVYDDDRGMRHYANPRLESFDALLREGRAALAKKPAFLGEAAARSNAVEPGFILFTPGATGQPKGVVLSQRALIDRARVAADADGLREDDIAMAYLPPAWVGQIMFGYVQPMVVGYCICCPESSETMLGDMREIGPTYFFAPPRVLGVLLAQVDARMDGAGPLSRRLYRSALAAARQERSGGSLGLLAGDILIRGPLRDALGLSRVRLAYTTGDAVDPELVMFFRSVGMNLKQVYSVAEAGFFVAMQPGDARRSETCGPALPGVQLKLAPDGEILVRSPGMFDSYVGDPDATAQALDADGWFRTGDIGELSDGELEVHDRRSHVGEERAALSMRAVENRLKLDPYVEEAVVFGGPGGMVCALIDINVLGVGRWADQHGLNFTGQGELAALDGVYGLITEAVARSNRSRPDSAAVTRFAILPEDLDADRGLLTRTGTLRRHSIAERYAALIAAMRAGLSEAPGEAGARPIRIGDVPGAAAQAGTGGQKKRAA